MNNEPRIAAISDDDLLLFHWRDGLSAERQAEIAEALRRDRGLQQRYVELSTDLAVLADAPEMGQDELFNARLRRSLGATPAHKRRIWPIAIAASVLLAIAIPLGMRAPDQAELAADLANGQRVQRSVQTHLLLASQQLKDLPSVPEADRQTIVQIWLTENRGLARAAEAAGDAQLARTLRAFEPLLLDLLRTPASTANADRQQLAFEWQVMQTKLAKSTSKSPPAGI